MGGKERSPRPHPAPGTNPAWAHLVRIPCCAAGDCKCPGRPRQAKPRAAHVQVAGLQSRSPSAQSKLQPSDVSYGPSIQRPMLLLDRCKLQGSPGQRCEELFSFTSPASGTCRAAQHQGPSDRRWELAQITVELYRASSPWEAGEDYTCPCPAGSHREELLEVGLSPEFHPQARAGWVQCSQAGGRGLLWILTTFHRPTLPRHGSRDALVNHLPGLSAQWPALCRVLCPGALRTWSNKDKQMHHPPLIISFSSPPRSRQKSLLHSPEPDLLGMCWPGQRWCLLFQIPSRSFLNVFKMYFLVCHFSFWQPGLSGGSGVCQSGK